MISFAACAEAFVFAETDGEPHNTITPIARMRDGMFELDLTLRNNITTEEHPLGVYHPHAEYHHIKKENIGLIEVMGLAVLPARLLNEIEELKKAILNNEDIASNTAIASHAVWAEGIKQKYTDINSGNIDSIIQDEIGYVFAEVLENAGIYKDDENGRNGFDAFIAKINE